MTTAAICATREVSWRPSFYRGEQYDSDLGLYYLRARYYNPATGRFLSRDPLEGSANDPASLHKYLYVGGDPVNLKDPTGRGVLETGEIDIKSPLEALALRTVSFLVKRCIWGIAATALAIAEMVYNHETNYFAEGAIAFAGGECLWKFIKLPPPLAPPPLWWITSGK
jgi:RHS repeat-associated protein